MGRLFHHPEAREAIIHSIAEARNARIRKALETPGFGFLVLLRRGYMLGSTPYDATTYAEAAEIVKRELFERWPNDYVDALIIKKSYNPRMMIGADPDRDKRPRFLPENDL